ncbi:antibiotic biosynthesis monooxygenase [Paenibacillus sp. CAU 1782]
MYIQLRTMTVKQGFGEQVAQTYAVPGHIDTMPGLIDRTVMVNARSKETEEVVILIRWESQDAWKNWEKDPVHIAGHRNKRNAEKPDYLLDVSVNMYHANHVFQGTHGKE